ncbi:MAG: hypothetical protein R3272_03580 [Candidatus Promineifilaceae bacterium]|nr:hypothetical protein [Candidatus Promineifilaceae bacterium]
MAKKVRRVRRRDADHTGGNTRAQKIEEQLHDEYAYVLQDLRRMFILAAIMFILLIAANIVL